MEGYRSITFRIYFKTHVSNLLFLLTQDVVYIKAKLKSTLEYELLHLYKSLIVEHHINHIFGK